jgi:signal transduction histidine kinase
MKFKDYIKDKLLLIILLVLAILSIETLLLAYQILPIIRIYIAVILILVVAIAMGIEYYKKKNFYNKLKQDLEELNEKYLISEIINTPGFTEGKILKEIIQETGKSMLENVNIYKNIQEDYKEYIELWIHEIKIPIATSKLIIENNKSNVTRSIDEELDKIDNYTEQALYYARSNDANKDYIITKTSLKEIVNMAVLKNKTNLLNNKVTVNLQEGLDKEVYTDSKWAVFILNQIIQNSIKYAKEADKTIEIFSEEKKEKVILYIKDNGIGIKKGEITRVFDKGFTGENGRIIGKKSTGIGLYLCKKLCDKLGIGIELNSKQNVGTEVRIVFPKNSYTKF